MTKKRQNISFSEPIKEIMERPPRYLTRVGTYGIIGLFSLFIILGWIIKYPDTIPGKIILTTENPPVELRANVSGRIAELVVNDKQLVSEGDIVAFIQSSADPVEIREFLSWVKEAGSVRVDVYSELPSFNRIGDLQEEYSIYRKAHSEFWFFQINDQYGKKGKSMLEEISGIEFYIRSLEVKEKMVSESLELEGRKYKRDSLLNRQGVISDAGFEISRQKYLAERIELQKTRLEIASRRIDLATRKGEYTDLMLIRASENERLGSQLREAFANLTAATDKWILDYLLISPSDGVVSFTKYWAVNQSVMSGETVMTIIPANEGEVVGKLELSMKRSGKVKPGHMVIIKLNGYPYMEYGAIEGRVISLSGVPEGDNYIAEVMLPNGLTSLYGKELAFTHNMDGIGEIITEDYRLLNKIFDPLKYLSVRNKLSKNSD